MFKDVYTNSTSNVSETVKDRDKEWNPIIGTYTPYTHACHS